MELLRSQLRLQGGGYLMGLLLECVTIHSAVPITLACGEYPKRNNYKGQRYDSIVQRKGGCKMIRITRKTPNVDMLVAYKIFIDGIYRGKIKRNEIKEFDAERGKHTVYAKMDWHRSNELNVNVTDIGAELEVGSTQEKRSIGTAENDLLSYLFSKREYLWLREKESADTPSEDIK